jgi:NADH-quinone oxidoreductase subunit M
VVLNEILASAQLGFPILSALVWLPALTAVALLFLREESLMRKLAITAAVAELLLALVVAANFVPGSSDIQFAERAAWMATLGASYHLGVDGLSVLFLPLSAFVLLMIMIFSREKALYSRFHLINLLVLESATMGIFCSLDMVLFYVFYELALVPSFFLIKLWGLGPQRRYAGIKYLTYMLVGSAPLLIGIILLGLNYNEAMAAKGQLGAYSFDLVDLLTVSIDPRTQALVFFLLAAGFAVKGPVWPFHTWLPTAVVEGPIAMGVYLVGLKIGAYGFLRFVLPLTPDASRDWFWLVAILGLLAILYGGLIALVQKNFRRLLAFASMSHVGLIMLGLFSFNAQGIQGALMLMVNAGIATAGLLFVAGFLHKRLGSTELSSFGGLARQMPKLATFCFIAGLALIGMPGTSGFTGEFLAMTGAFRAHWVLGAVAALGVILSAGYFLWYYERAFFGPVTNPSAARLADLKPSEMMIAVPIIALVFAIGFFPKPLMDMTKGSVAALEKRVKVGALPGVNPVAALPPATAANPTSVK